MALRPDVIKRNKSKKQRESVKKSWQNKEIREKRIEKMKKITGEVKATYGHLGKKHTENTKQMISKSRRGKTANENHPKWKGDGVSYSALHIWIKRHKGKPKKCIKCGKINKKKGDVHWSNIDHKYKRKLEDYKALCPKCHKKWDLEHKLTKH